MLMKYLKGRGHLEDLGVDGRIILEWILGKQDRKAWIGLIWFRIGPLAGSCEHSYVPSGSLKGGEFLD
jgi:hypothetical protein